MTHLRRLSTWLVIATAWAALPSSSTFAQEPAASPLRVSGVSPAGLRNSVSDRWCEMTVTVSNFGPTPRDARVVVNYEGQPFDGYARDLTVPAYTNVTATVAVGPAPKQGPALSRTIQFVVYDRTSGTPVVVRPAGDERTRDRAVLYRANDITTALFADYPTGEDQTSFRQPSPYAEALTVVRVVRSMQNASSYVTHFQNPNLPTTAEAFAGLDLVVVANNRLRADPAGRAAVRRWVEQGGQVWVMLDQVDPEVVGALLGEEFAPHVVDRTSLTKFHVERTKAAAGAVDRATGLLKHERPVPFVRVALSGREEVIHYVDAWPASFTHRLGRGKVLFTTLGPAAWHRPRLENANPSPRPGINNGDPPSPYEEAPDLPVGLDHLLELVGDLKVAEHPFTTAELRDTLMDEIGYTVPGRMPVAAVLGAFVVGLVGIAFALRRSRKTEVVGWLVPGVAILAAGLFVTFGRASRHAIPPTIAVAETVEAIPATGEVARRGLFATYQPDSGPVPLAAPHGGLLEFNFEGLEGQNRVRVQTDQDAWHYENLAMPAGVRDGRYRVTSPMSLSAVASFGPDGLQGRLQSGSYREPADGLLVARTRRSNGVRFTADGGFASAPEDELSPGQFLTGAVLTDRQQRRQGVYRKLLAGALPPHLSDRDILLAWATPTDLPFTAGESARATGTSLLVLPVEYQQPPPGTRVRVPSAFVPYQRVLEGKLARMVTMDSNFPIDLRLRFQLPPSVVPLTLQKAVVHVKMKAAARAVTFTSYTGDKPAVLQTAEGPTEPIRLDVTDEKLLSVDAEGGWHFGINIGPAINSANKLDEHWSIESISLEIDGRTAERR